jgi:hypothetical protein
VHLWWVFVLVLVLVFFPANQIELQVVGEATILRIRLSKSL